MIFTPHGFLRGFRLAVPLALSVGTYGLVFGMLSKQSGLEFNESLLMSLTVFAGVSQLIAMQLWTAPLPVAAIVLTTFLVNARHLFMGAALQPWFKKLSWGQAYGSLFFCADENWALAVKEFRRGEKDGAFLLGGGFVIYVGWVLATMIGFAGGLMVRDPAAWGLDFAFVAVFIALMIGLWRGKKDLIPWCVAGVGAVVAAKFLPGKWYILIGTFLGSLLEFLRVDDA